uniref:Reverse transcriptase zinc-binding domain-containing protein n=1 Tax=Aegilops tauschii subsp. strangulata TaxID=200361 RepID=A0A453T444_AEGTS
TWAQILRSKYLHSKTLSQVTARPTDSPFWKGLMNVKLTLFSRTKFIIGNSASTRFWEDTWLGETPLPFNTRLCIVLFNDVRRSLQRYFNPTPL